MILSSYNYSIQNICQCHQRMKADPKIFYKYQGAGNDFIIVQPEFFDLENQRTNQNTFSETEKIIIVSKVIELCHRNFGIGADGLLIVSKIGQTYKMSVFNSDCTMGANCGNGLRCVAMFLHVNKHLGTHLNILTDSGLKEVAIEKNTEGEYLVQINLGTVHNIQQISLSSYPQIRNRQLLQKSSLFSATLGNKHLIIYLPEEKYQQIASRNAYVDLAKGLRKGNENINFCVVKNENQIYIVTCQFGAGVTLACGTGSTASAFVGWKTGQLKERVIVRTRGGILEIEVRKTEKGEETLMKGPAKLVFGGSIL